MIRVQNLTKNFGAIPALKGISFDIGEGEFFGLLGPNGAGKTTTISIISTIVAPDSGDVSIAGFDLKRDPEQCKRNMGVVPQEIALYNELSAFDNLMFWGSLYGLRASEARAAIDRLLDLFGLLDRKKDRVKTYSGGMKRRINIAAALLHRPKILLMDEPTVGVDPQSRNLIFEVIEKLHREGMTIVYTTHYMEEAERLCDRIAIIDNGQIIAQGSLEELKKSAAARETIVVTMPNLTEEMMGRLSSGWKELKQSGQEVHFYTSNVKSDLSRVMLKCNEAGLDISNIEIQKVNLETVFLSLTGKQLRD